jgi:hypothetical protein
MLGNFVGKPGESKIVCVCYPNCFLSIQCTEKIWKGMHDWLDINGGTIIDFLNSSFYFIFSKISSIIMYDFGNENNIL